MSKMEMTIILSKEQLEKISEQLSSVIFEQIELVKNQTIKHYRYMNKKQACQYLQVANNTLDTWIKEGLPVIKINNSSRYDKIAIDHWLESKQQQQN